jgi:hypothetical protein
MKKTAIFSLSALFVFTVAAFGQATKISPVATTAQTFHRLRVLGFMNALVLAR